MTPVEFKICLNEFLEKFEKRTPSKTEFSKKLIMGTLVFVALVFVLCYITWLIRGDWPRDVIYFFIPPFIGIASYMLKSGYENKAKIENNRKNGA